MIKMVVTAKEINEKWSMYDKVVATSHLKNYGEIYLDEYGCPIDNYEEIEELRASEEEVGKFFG